MLRCERPYAAESPQTTGRPKTMTIRGLLMTSLAALALGGCSVSFMGTPSSAAPRNDYGSYGYGVGKPIASADYGRVDDRGKPMQRGSSQRDDDRDEQPTAKPVAPQRTKPAKPPQRTKPAPQRTKPTVDPIEKPTRRPIDPNTIEKPTRRPIDPDSVDKPSTRPSLDRPSSKPASKPAPKRKPQVQRAPSERVQPKAATLESQRAVLRRTPSR
jgi:hypothetical protein